MTKKIVWICLIFHPFYAFSQDFETYQNRGVQFFNQKKWDLAAENFYFSIKSSQKTDASYELSQYMLAESLFALKAYFPSFYFYMNVAKNRFHPSLLFPSLKKIELLSRLSMVNERKLYTEFLSESDFGVVPDEIKYFINYAIILDAIRKNHLDWAKDIFFQMPKNNLYTQKSHYALAVAYIKENKDDIALEFLHDLSKENIQDFSLQNDVFFALARILFENKNYEEAILYYEKLSENISPHKKAYALIEKAWCYYYTDQINKALDQLEPLYSFSYSSFLLPEKYLLSAMSYAKNCHFLRARHMINDYYILYESEIDLIESSTDFLSIPILKNALFYHYETEKKNAYIANIKNELIFFKKNFGHMNTIKDIFNLYEEEIKHESDVINEIEKKSSKDIALYIVNNHENIRILDYELEEKILKRHTYKDIKSNHLKTKSSLSKTNDMSVVFFPFEKEYWEDELFQYQHTLENACPER
jgi:hypothetical protein